MEFYKFCNGALVEFAIQTQARKVWQNSKAMQAF